MLIPGVISHATNVVEHPELVAERIVRLARLVGRENVIAGTDCGFAQGPFHRRVHPSIMWAKLGALAKERGSPAPSCGDNADWCAGVARYRAISVRGEGEWDSGIFTYGYLCALFNIDIDGVVVHCLA